MASLGFLAVNMFQKGIAKENALQGRLAEAEKKILELTSAPSDIEDALACPNKKIEEMSQGVYWVLLNDRMWTIDTNVGNLFPAPGSCGIDYSTSTRDGLFSVLWGFYAPGHQEDFFVASSGEPIVSVGTSPWSAVSLETKDKKMNIALNVPDCGKEFSSEQDFHYPVKDLIVNDRRIALLGQHLATCALDGESGGMVVTDEIRLSNVSLEKHQAIFVLPWGELVIVDLDLDPAKVTVSSK
jgi:hypothetical protein